jgi:hypothetical protein
MEWGENRDEHGEEYTFHLQQNKNPKKKKRKKKEGSKSLL